MSKLTLGLDIGGTSIKAGVLDSDANIVFKTAIETNPDSGYENIKSNIINLIKNLNQYYNFEIIGVGVPGVVTDTGMIVDAPNFKNWINIPLLADLKSELKFPIYVDNDANTAAIAELELGAGRKMNTFLYVTLGTGIGGAIVYRGELFKGANGGAGEIGHTLINAFDSIINHTKTYRTGVLEVATGRNFIIDYAQKLKTVYEHSIVPYDFDIHHLDEAFYKNDLFAIEVFQNVGMLIGSAVASASNLLDIPNIIFGGGISKSNAMLNRIEQFVKLKSLPSIREKLIIKQAFFIEDTGIVGAALYAINQTKRGNL